MDNEEEDGIGQSAKQNTRMVVPYGTLSVMGLLDGSSSSSLEEVPNKAHTNFFHLFLQSCLCRSLPASPDTSCCCNGVSCTQIVGAVFIMVGLYSVLWGKNEERKQVVQETIQQDSE
ncbi:unnamed protein product [Cochlearia groenlandica]